MTLAWLWQLKEWRWDRLTDHLRSEGVFLQLWGKIRPSILVTAYGLLGALRPDTTLWSILTLSVLTVFSIVQAMLGRQRIPVRTQKALAIVAGACAIDILLTLSIVTVSAQASPLILPLLTLLQPLTIAASWLLFSPVDRHLKNKIFTRARNLRDQHPNLTVIGITGSVGKTTTKELLAHILADRAIATPAYVNTEMGVAQWLTKQLSNVKSQPATVNCPLSIVHCPFVIIEMGAYAPGEISLLCSIAKPRIGVVTYVGTQHLALFGSQEKLFETKSELIRSLPSDGHAFLNADSEWAAKMKDLAPCPVTMVTTDAHGDIRATNIEETPTGIRFTLGGTVFALPLHGTHNTVNALLAIAVSRSLGLADSDIQKRLATYSPPSHTFAVREEKTIHILDDTHNSSEASVKAAIAWARTQPYAEKTLLMSGLIELGEAEERAHAELGGFAKTVFQRVIFTHERGKAAFEKGYGRPIELLSRSTAPIHQHSLLVCVGRISQSLIKKLLPNS